MLVHHLETNSKQLIMQRPSSSFYININTLVNALPPNIRERLLALHAFSGCGTGSLIYGRGKTRVIKLAEEDPAIAKLLSCFYLKEFVHTTFRALGPYEGKKGDALTI